jgi:CBS domain-containing protein
MKRKGGGKESNDISYSDLQTDGLLYRMAAFSYSEPLSDIMVSDLFCCRPEDNVRKVAGDMAFKKISSVIVTDDSMQPVGIVTERDIVSKVVSTDFCSNPNITISDIMTSNPICLSPDDSLFDALSILQRHRIKHLPIIEDGKVIGIVSMRQIMKVRYSEPLAIIGQLDKAETAADLKAVREEMIPLTKERLTSNTDPVDIITMISLVNRSIHKKLLKKTIKEYGEEPPIDFCFFVTGSLGRVENLLFPDQDFCLITDDYDNKLHAEYDEYFKNISQKFSDALNEAGFPYCTGKVMAQNPDWRKSISGWQTFITQCLNKADDLTVRYMTLIFDSAPLLGSAALFDKYIDYAYYELSKNHNVLRMMHDDEEGKHRVPLGWFNKFITEKEKDHKGELDMKRSGLIFIIETARILAIKHGIHETSTIKRLQELVKKGVINAEDSEYFENAYRVILHHTLQAQTENYLKSGSTDYHLNPGRLSHRNQKILKEAFKAISRLQELVGSEFGELIL